MNTSHDLFNIMGLININNGNINKHFSLKIIFADVMVKWIVMDGICKELLWDIQCDMDR